MSKEVVVSLDRIEQLLAADPTSPFRDRALHDEAERFLLRRMRSSPRPERLVIYLPPGELPRARGLPAVFRQHFKWRADQLRHDLEEMWYFARRSLATGFAVLCGVLVVVEMLSRWFGSGAFARSLQEGLTILGWVALWRPSEMLMYEWRSLDREAQLLSELSRLDIEVRAAPFDRPNPSNAAERN